MTRFVWLSICAFWLKFLPLSGLNINLPVSLPVHIVLVIPNDEVILDTGALQVALEAAMPQHVLPFLGKNDNIDDPRLAFFVNWNVSMAPPIALNALEGALAQYLSSTTSPLSPSSETGRGVPVRVADDVLSTFHRSEWWPTRAAGTRDEETVLFVLSPRKAKVFGAEELRRQRYHYQGAAAVAGLAPGCVSAWVGRGRYLVVDLSAGPCEWGSDSGSDGGGVMSGHPAVPHVGDGSQGPRSVLDALGLRPLSSPSRLGKDGESDSRRRSAERKGRTDVEDGDRRGNLEIEKDDNVDDDNDDDEEEQDEDELKDEQDEDELKDEEESEWAATHGLRLSEEDKHKRPSPSLSASERSRNVLTAQVVALASSAISSVLCPWPVSADLFAAVPTRVVVPVAVLSPDDGEAGLPSDLNVTALQALLYSALPRTPPAHSSASSPRQQGGGLVMSVVAGAHELGEHPDLGVALAQAVRSKTTHRLVPQQTPSRQRSRPAALFEAVESSFVDAAALFSNVLGSGDALTHALLQDARLGLEDGDVVGEDYARSRRLWGAGRGAAGQREALLAEVGVRASLMGPGSDDDSVGNDGDDGGGGPELQRVLPLFVLSDVTQCRAPLATQGKQRRRGGEGSEASSGDTGDDDDDDDGDDGDDDDQDPGLGDEEETEVISFEQNLFAAVSPDYRVVVVLHSSSSASDSADSGPRRGAELKATKFVSRVKTFASTKPGDTGGDKKEEEDSGRLWLDPTDATAAAGAGLLTALTGLQVGTGRDLTWANGYHPFQPFSLGDGGGRDDERGPGSRARELGWVSPLHLSPVHADGMTRTAVAANLHVMLGHLRSLTEAANALEDLISKGLCKPSTVGDGSQYPQEGKEGGAHGSDSGDGGEVQAAVARWRQRRGGPHSLLGERRTLSELLDQASLGELLPFQILASLDEARAAVASVARRADEFWRNVAASSPPSSLAVTLETALALRHAAARAHHLHTTGSMPATGTESREGVRVFGLSEVEVRWTATCSSSGGLRFEVDDGDSHAQKSSTVLAASLLLAGVAVFAVAKIMKRKTVARRYAERLGTWAAR